MPAFCCPFGLFRHFWGVFRCLPKLSMDRVKAGHCCLKRHGPRGRFLAKIWIHCMIFQFSAKEDIPMILFSGQPGKIFKLSAPIQTIFASLLELYTFRCSLWPSTRLRHSLKSTLMTTPAWQMLLTRQVHSLGRGLYFDGNSWLFTRLVSRICHTGAAANVDFKLMCRSLADGHKLRRKV